MLEDPHNLLSFKKSSNALLLHVLAIPYLCGHVTSSWRGMWTEGGMLHWGYMKFVFPTLLTATLAEIQTYCRKLWKPFVPLCGYYILKIARQGN